MSIKTITKIACFVIPLLLTANCASVSFSGAEHAEIGAENGGFERAEVIAHIASKDINESSGLAVSKCQEDVFWTHNDSGGGPFIYAFNSKGESRGAFRIKDVTAIDWEDMATVKTPVGCFIYIGEIGDNDRKHDSHSIIRIQEPLVSDETALASRDKPRDVNRAEILRFQYPDENQDAEALLVESSTQTIYIVTKHYSGQTKVYKVKPDFGSPQAQVDKIGEISLPANPQGLVTGGDISPDGRHLVLCDYYAGYEFQLPAGSEEFDEIWKQKPAAFDLGPRRIGEAIAFGSDANTIFATTEGLDAPVIRVIRKRK
jgi:hypothetical protein